MSNLLYVLKSPDQPGSSLAHELKQFQFKIHVSQIFLKDDTISNTLHVDLLQLLLLFQCVSSNERYAHLVSKFHFWNPFRRPREITKGKLKLQTL